MSDQEQKVEVAAAAVEGAPDKTIPIGEIGKIEIDFHLGKAELKLSAAAPGGVGVEGGAFIKCDADVLVGALFDAIKKKLPPAVGAIVDGAKLIVVNALKAID